MEVTVKKQSADKSVNAAERRADWWLFGGIYRPVYLTAKPRTQIEHIAVDARADRYVAHRCIFEKYFQRTTIGTVAHFL